MKSIKLERECEHFPFNEGHNLLSVIGIEPPVLDRDEKLVAFPVPSMTRLALGSSPNPSEMARPGLSMVHGLQFVLDPTACSLVALDRERASKRYLAVLNQIRHPYVLGWVTSGCDLESECSRRLMDLSVDVAAWVSLWLAEHVVAISVSSDQEEAQGVELFMKPLEWTVMEKDGLSKPGHLSKQFAFGQDPLAELSGPAAPDALREGQKSVEFRVHHPENP